MVIDRISFKSVCLVPFLLLGVLANDAWARRTVKGRITDPSGKGVSGLRIRAWDSDGTSGNDFMGEAYTNGDGRYVIKYRGGHWDPAPHRVTKWRPDIFVKVLVKNQRGQWVRTTRSKVHSDHRLREDLTINLQVPSNVTIRRFTQFKPDVHQFPFVNSARKICARPTCRDEHLGKAIVAAVAPKIDPVLMEAFQRLTRFDWALCGGMSLTALENFRNGVKPQEWSPKLKEKIVINQIRTLAPTVWFKFIKWQARPTKPHAVALHTIGASTKKEWPRVRQVIDAGAPVILGIIRVQNQTAGNVSKNHQVLAIGYEYNDLTKDVVVHCYDPNYSYGPGETSTLSFSVGIPQNQIHAEQVGPKGNLVTDSEGKRVKTRGFFVIGEGCGPPKKSVYSPSQTNVAKASGRPTQGRVLRRVHRRGVDGTETEEFEEVDPDEVAFLEASLTEWAEDEDAAAALAQIEAINGALEQIESLEAVQTRDGREPPGLAEARERLRRLIAPDDD